MSRKILKASCSTLNPQDGGFDWVNFLENTENYNPNRLTVFVGDRIPGKQYSALASTGGLLARQCFRWENYPVKDINRYFVDFSQASVTLTVKLHAKEGASSSMDTVFTGELPSDTMAINLSSKFNQGTVDGGINEDCWGKLVYYDTGALGQGIVFSPADYVDMSKNDGSGIFFNGGALPDYSDFTISMAINNSTTTARTPSANLQMGRSNSLISQATLGNITGLSSYWSIGIEPILTTQTGNIGGQISNCNVAKETTFTPWLHFGTPTVGYPNFVETDNGTDEMQYWQATNPQYGRNTSDGMLPCGNCISIVPSVFMSDNGFKLLTNAASNPGGAAAEENKRWTTYFSMAGTNLITLKETQPLYIPAPISSGPLPLEMIPGGTTGLFMLVPITRINNGVTFYTPYVNSVTTSSAPNLLNDFKAYSSAVTTGGAKSYFRPAQGLLYKWFDIAEVKMTLNIPAYRLDSVEEVRRFFNTLIFEPTLKRNSSIWLKWGLTDTKPIANSINLLSLNSLQANNSKIEFTLTARGILEKVNEVLKMYGISQSAREWPTNNLSIRQVCAMCTTTYDLEMLYSKLLPQETYRMTPVGSILTNGGTKAFTRLGPNLSGGPPYNMTVKASDLTTQLGEFDSTYNYYYVEVDALPPTGNSRFNRNNDFACTCPMGIAGQYPSLRIPNLNASNDFGGTLEISFNTEAYLNFPWSGPVSVSVSGGGPSLHGFTKTNMISETMLSGYAKGWFNNLNPFSPDYDPNAIPSGVDQWLDLDSRLVNFNARAVEIWVEIGLEIPVYTTFPSAHNTTADDKIQRNVRNVVPNTNFSTYKDTSEIGAYSMARMMRGGS